MVNYLGLIFTVKIIVIGSEVEVLGNLGYVNRFNGVGNVYVRRNRGHNL